LWALWRTSATRYPIKRLAIFYSAMASRLRRSGSVRQRGQTSSAHTWRSLRVQTFSKQIARNVTMGEWGFLDSRRYPIHDRDMKFTDAFRAIVKFYLVPFLLGRNPQPLDIWHASNLEWIEYAR